jgi:hypothetical protein
MLISHHHHRHQHSATAITNLGSQQASEGFFSGDEKVADEPLCKQKQHAKVRQLNMQHQPSNQ